MSILVVGTIALDSVQTPFGKVENVLGGSAAYFAVSASFFSKVKLVSIAGRDFPQEHISFLQAKGIDTAGLQIEEGETFRWTGRYGYNLNNAETLKTELNLLSQFKPVLSDGYKNERFVFLANIDPHVQLEILEQVNNPKLIVTDTMNYWIENERDALKEVVRKSDILILNDGEAREFSQESNLIRASRVLLDLGPRLVIIKRGEYGCSLFSRTFSFYIPAYLLESVADPTGAGDSFAGGFLGCLAECEEITESCFKKAIVYGTIIASYVAEDFSLNRLRNLTRRDIDDRFKEFQCLTNF